MSLPAFNPNSPTFFDDTKAATAQRFRELLASPNLTVFAFATSSLRGVPIQFVRVNELGVVTHDMVIKTFKLLDPESQAYHGIQQAQVDAAELLRDQMPLLRSLLGDSNDVIAFSPDFMREALVRGCKDDGVECFGTSHWLDGQALLSHFCGVYNWTTHRWSKPKLIDCIRDLPMPAHFAPIGTAKGNAQRLHALMLHFAGLPERMESGFCGRCGLAEDCTCGLELAGVEHDPF